MFSLIEVDLLGNFDQSLFTTQEFRRQSGAPYVFPWERPLVLLLLLCLLLLLLLLLPFLLLLLLLFLLLPPLLRDGKLIFGGEQRRNQDICL